MKVALAYLVAGISVIVFVITVANISEHNADREAKMWFAVWKAHCLNEFTQKQCVVIANAR